MKSVRVPVLIVGGTCGGVAAAIACARNGVRCLVVEPTAWIGGQLTAQAVPPDENPWVEGNGPHAPPDFRGVTASYAQMRDMVRAWYRNHRPLRAEARADTLLNPGRGWVSRLCAEPRIIEQVLREILTQHPLRGMIELLTSTEIASVDSTSDKVTTVLFRNRVTGDELSVDAGLVLDATDLGDVLELAGTESSIGAESQAVYSEMHARTDLRDGHLLDESDQQAFSWCFAVEHRPGENHTISRPDAYSFWASYIPQMAPPWTGPLFSWTVPSHDALHGRTLNMRPWPAEPEPSHWELWRYRRIVDHTAYLEAESAEYPDVCLVNWVQMDHWLHPLLGVTAEQRQTAFTAAREQSLCLLYWMQTEAPRHDHGTGYPGLRLRGTELGSTDGLALAPYIREPRRLQARTILTEREVGTEQRRIERRPNQDATKWGAGETYPDSIAIGHYPIDLHPSCAGRNNVYVPACPFQVPLSALVPVRVRNLLAAGKCLGVSHVVNGCTRLHPVEWAVGEAAGLIAAWCQTNGTEPHAVCEDPASIADIRRLAQQQGMPTAWPWDQA